MYLVLIIYLLLFYIFYSTQQDSNAKACRNYAKAASCILLFMSAFRHEAVGNDTYAYLMQFDSFSSSWKEIFNSFFIKYFIPGNMEKDPGYDIVMKLCSYVTKDSRIFLVIVSFVTIVSLYYFIVSSTNNLRAVFFSYLFFSVMFFQYIPNSSFRQALAFSILLFSYKKMAKKKWLPALVLIFIASTIHKSALCGIAILILNSLNNVRLVYRLSIIAFIIVLIFPTEVASILGATSDVYSAYAYSSYYQSAAKPYMVILLMSGLFLIGMMIISRDDRPVDNKMLYYGAAMAFALTPLVWSDPSTLRLLSYFGLYLSILIGERISTIPNGGKIFIVVVSVFILKGVVSGGSYHFMWQYMQLHDRYYSSILCNTINFFIA